MADGMAGGSLDQLRSALEAVKTLRCGLGNFFETISSGFRPEVANLAQEEREKIIKTELHTYMQQIFENLRDVDSQIGSLNAPNGPFTLGNTSYINQEVCQEKIPLYGELVDSYKYLEKVHDFAGIAAPILSQNNLKRSYISTSLSSKRRRTIHSFNTASPAVVDNAVSLISSSFKDMEVNIQRPLGSNAALCITLGRTLKSIVILKGWLIEWVVVRAVSEDMVKDDGSLDMWSESRYKVFQKITDTANAAMLHFLAPTHPELSVRSFLTWLHSFTTLFTDPCKKCNLHLLNNLPPTWRDFRSLEPYHEECKP